jgi:hypothetical protein
VEQIFSRMLKEIHYGSGWDKKTAANAVGGSISGCIREKRL